MFERQLLYARSALAAGNLAVCEIICRDILDKDAGVADALNLLGIVTAQAGAPEDAAALFEAALRLLPESHEVAKNLARARQAVPAPRMDNAGARYLLIKSWGAGFWSDVTQLLGSLLLAEVTGRIPVVHWGGNSLFRGEGDGDAFALYFQSVSQLSLRDLAGMADATFFPPKWNGHNLAREEFAKWSGEGSRAAAIYFLGRPETIAVSDFFVGVIDVAPWLPAGHAMWGKKLDDIYRYLIGKYLRPQADAVAACDAFFQAHLAGGPFAAVHIRGSDKVLEDEKVAATNQAVLVAMAAIPADWRIFLLTDDEGWRARVLAQYGARVVTTPCQRTQNATGVHFLPSVDPLRAGREVMLDTYLALRADRFIGAGMSNVSAMIAVMRDWEPGACTLIGPSLLMVRNLFVHIRT